MSVLQESYECRSLSSHCIYSGVIQLLTVYPKRVEQNKSLASVPIDYLTLFRVLLEWIFTRHSLTDYHWYISATDAIKDYIITKVVVMVTLNGSLSDYVEGKILLRYKGARTCQQIICCFHSKYFSDNVILNRYTQNMHHV